MTDDITCSYHNSFPILCSADMFNDKHSPKQKTQKCCKVYSKVWSQCCRSPEHLTLSSSASWSLVSFGSFCSAARMLFRKCSMWVKRRRSLFFLIYCREYERWIIINLRSLLSFILSTLESSRQYLRVLYTVLLS